MQASSEEAARKMRSKCNVNRQQRPAASAATDQKRDGTVEAKYEHSTGRRPARTRAGHGPRMSLGAAVLLVALLGPALEVRHGPSTTGVSGSEFPERECCDPVYPPMPDPDPVPGPAYPTTTISTSSSFQTGQSGIGGGGLIGGGTGGSTAVGNELGGGLIGTGSGSQLSSSRPMHIGYSGEFKWEREANAARLSKGKFVENLSKIIIRKHLRIKRKLCNVNTQNNTLSF